MSTGERIYVEELAERIEQLEAERKEMIDALIEAYTLIQNWGIDAFNLYNGSAKEEQQVETLKNIQKVLRNAGEEMK